MALWRRVAAWWNAPDTITVEFIPISFVQPGNPEHCERCARAACLTASKAQAHD